MDRQSSTQTSPDEIAAWQLQAVKKIDQGLKTVILDAWRPDWVGVANLLKSMYYTISAGGKRLRALLALASAEAVGGESEQAFEAAMAAELIHAYSLIHDDLPALDDDALRRGQPTCHLVFGEATAILAGDALQTLAFGLLAGGIQYSFKTGSIPQGIRLEAIKVLAEAIGAFGMVGGQAMDLALEKTDPLLATVLEMETLKTGRLLSASMAMGGIFGGGSEVQIESLTQAGLAAGLAFQIKDDLLNFSGDPAIMGKNVGTDAQKGKASIVAAVGPEAAAKLASEYSEKALALSGTLGSPKLHQLISSAIDRNR
ncbi:MAG: polyprenyl synthetase family protein [Deltaproteobacteria bacterium]|jgi:geranylgeranyl diphosphate synthase type II|nr:polyprenyl synthetase family protein [Deltaproteobacteria bacterium]